MARDEVRRRDVGSVITVTLYSSLVALWFLQPSSSFSFFVLLKRRYMQSLLKLQLGEAAPPALGCGVAVAGCRWHV
jgi:hypothetical protein